MSSVPDHSIATAPNAPHDLQSLIQEINSHSNAFSNGQTDARLRLVAAAQSLVQAMETPQETMLRYIWAQPTAFAAIETCFDLGVFTILAQNDEPRTVLDLAAATGSDEELLGRLLKHLGAMGVIVETAPDTYRRNGFSTTLSMPRYGEPFPCITGCTISAVHSIPQWLKTNNYRTPTNGKQCPFNLGFGTDLHFFEFMGANPHLAAQFNNLMSAYHQGRPSWMDANFYPVREQLLCDARNGPDDVLLVDVGGNRGHDLEEFRAKVPEASGKLILQDLPGVISQVGQLDARVQPMAHDFWTEQPVKGARAYFLHSILHDWNDQDCHKILKNLADAMEPGYSKLLINENVIPDTGAHWQATSLDLVMMADFASQERTEKQWYRLIEGAGLKICKIWTVLASAESLIECQLA